MFQCRMQCATSSSCDVVGFSWSNRVRAATGGVFCSKGRCTLGSAGGSTLGDGVCTIGDGGSTLGAGWRILGYRRSYHLSFVVGTGGGGGAWGVVLSPYHLTSVFWRAWMASNWSQECGGGDFYKAEVNFCITCSTLSSVVTEGWVRCWWQNSMVSEIDRARESLGMYRWHW